MKIFTMEYPPLFTGGAGVYAKELSIAFSKKKIPTIVYIFNDINKIEKINDYLILNWIRITAIKGLKTFHAIWKKYQILNNYQNTSTIINVNTMLGFKFLASITNEITIVHHSPRESRSQSGFKIFELFGDASILPFGDYLFKKAVQNSNKIIFVSQITRKFFLKSYPSLSNKLNYNKTIYNGVPTYHRDFLKNIENSKLNELYFLSKKFDFILTYVGSRDSRKGTDILIKGFKYYINNYNDKNLKIALILAGGKQHYSNVNDLKNIIDHTNQASTIIDLGRLNNHFLAQIYMASNYIVLASYSEGLSTLILEGLTYSTPFISTNTAGPRDIFSQTGAGLLTKIGSYKDFAKNIIVATNDETYQSLKAQAHSNRNKFTWEHSIDEYIKLIKDTT